MLQSAAGEEFVCWKATKVRRSGLSSGPCDDGSSDKATSC